MTDSLHRALLGRPERPELVFERTYRASAKDLRDALTDPSRLARWFGDVAGDPASVGDTFTATLSEDEDDVASGRVLACEASEICVAWSWQGELESVITARITDVDDAHATLTLHHALAQQDHAIGYGGGWEQILESLARSLGAADADIPSDDELETAGSEAWRTLTRAPLDFSRTVPAPIDRVWHAFSTTEGLATWWWNHWDGVEVAFDAATGSPWRTAYAPFGIAVGGTFLAVEAPARVAFTWEWEDEDGTSRHEAVDVRLESVPEGTRIHLRQSGPWSDDAPAQSYREGWDEVLDALETTLTA